ncbi:aldehyde dehydrogenase family protein [Pseudomonas syringae pv. actinidiae]|nr:aldehyde dehydrogenase family protein [Pseudomonas syringae pv. actinidiae]
MISGDPTRLRQTLLSLLENALKKTDEGEILLGVALESSKSGKPRLRISVQDSGESLSDEERDELLHAELHSRNFLASSRLGGHLGLVIARQLIILMDGEFGIQNSGTPGNTLWLNLPLGVIGVIVPWNYPLFLAIGPLIGALAAGNRVMLKLSESTPATGALLKRLLANVFPEDLVAVVLGEAETGMAFSRLPFDHLLFTGATSIGKHVMRAAAENLTPVTLELGGKSPAIVSQDVPLQDAAERIAFGKTLNAGQTCIAPDYVLVPKDRLTGFVNAYTAAVKRFYPTLIDNPDYTAIINHRQLLRLNHYLEDAANKGAKIITLYEQGQDRRMPFSVLLDVSDDMLVMQDEIFGPLLPVVPYDRIEDAYAYINQRPRPLALYYFGYDKAEQRQVLERTHSGGVSINDTLMHAAQDDLPFGGVGPSGMGNYHGREGFLTFSQAKAVFTKQRLNAARLIYPPYGKAIQRLIYKLFMR